MTPIESKRLIATFMNYAGGKPLTDELLLTLYNDWNSIMPVVDKIEDIIVDGDNSFNVTIGATNYCVIQDSWGELIEISDIYRETKLLTVEATIVKFIQWYYLNQIT